MKYTELEVGCWYKVTVSYNWLFKYTDTDVKDSFIWGTHWCTPNDNYYHNINPLERACSSFSNIYTIATEEEVKKMYPKEEFIHHKIVQDYEIY